MREENKVENTYVFDPENPTEMARLIELHNMFKRTTNGTFSGIDPLLLSKSAIILDVACGPGSWALDAAFEMPYATIEGIDISRIMVDYANARARTEKLYNVSFGVMDIRQTLDYSDATFDLINARFLFGVLKKESWIPFLKECKRLLKKGGILRLTEPRESGGKTNSFSYERIIDLIDAALFTQGYGYTVNGKSPDMPTIFPSLLQSIELENIQQYAYMLDFGYNSENWHSMHDQLNVSRYTIPPFLEKLGFITKEEIDELYMQAELEYYNKNFVGSLIVVTTLTTKEK